MFCTSSCPLNGSQNIDLFADSCNYCVYYLCILKCNCTYFCRIGRHVSAKEQIVFNVQLDFV